MELATAMDTLTAGLSDEERAGLEKAVPGMRRVLARGAAADEVAGADGPASAMAGTHSSSQ
jgi:hypothetical protein